MNCRRLLQLVITPGQVGSRDGPLRFEAWRCHRRHGHELPHNFRAPRPRETR